ncbi:hypothetical protein FQZ97_718690 [compost metagenome]
MHVPRLITATDETANPPEAGQRRIDRNNGHSADRMSLRRNTHGRRQHVVGPRVGHVHGGCLHDLLRGFLNAFGHFLIRCQLAGEVVVGEETADQQAEWNEDQDGDHLPTTPDGHPPVHGLLITNVERLALRSTAVVLVNFFLVGAVGLANQQLLRDPLAGGATAIDLDAEAIGGADFLQLVHMETVRDQLTHPGCEVGRILSDQHDLHGVALGVHPVTVLLKPLEIIDGGLVDLLTAGPAPPAFVDHGHRAVRNQAGKLRIVQGVERQLGDATAIHLGEQIGLQGDVGHDMAALIQGRNHHIFDDAVGLARAGLAEIAVKSHLTALPLANQRDAPQREAQDQREANHGQTLTDGEELEEVDDATRDVAEEAVGLGDEAGNRQILDHPGEAVEQHAPKLLGQPKEQFQQPVQDRDKGFFQPTDDAVHGSPHAVKKSRIAAQAQIARNSQTRPAST